MLNADRAWDDKGTGHVSCAYVDQLQGMALVVRSEDDDRKFNNSNHGTLLEFISLVLVICRHTHALCLVPQQPQSICSRGVTGQLFP